MVARGCIHGAKHGGPAIPPYRIFLEFLVSRRTAPTEGNRYHLCDNHQTSKRFYARYNFLSP